MIGQVIINDNSSYGFKKFPEKKPKKTQHTVPILQFPHTYYQNIKFRCTYTRKYLDIQNACGFFLLAHPAYMFDSMIKETCLNCDFGCNINHFLCYIPRN